MGLRIFEGAGAYICGEESALMNSLQGLRGESRFKPPFPPSQGLWERPTIINNVETLMNIPHIIQNGADGFSQIGTAKSKGTKVFSVCGDVARPGVYELVMGSRLKELVEDIAGAEDLKAVQVGGASGNILPRAMIDIPLSHETVLGSGGILVLNNSRDIIDFVYKDLEFLNEESCGKCTPCREGTEVMVEILGRLNAGDGTIEDIDALKDLAQAMSLSSLCGLGQAAPVPVLDSLKYFHQDYASRIQQAVFLRNYQGGHSK
jgi:NADH:ubiquinone oxidoreductase subunit F (NADH-binding)